MMKKASALWPKADAMKCAERGRQLPFGSMTCIR